MSATVNVRIPSSLRPQCGNQELVSVTGGTVGEVLKNLTAQYGGIASRLFAQNGGVSRWINVFVNQEDIRFLSELETPLQGGEEVSIVPAVAGGA
jgi:MoaD family protein